MQKADAEICHEADGKNLKEKAPEKFSGAFSWKWIGLLFAMGRAGACYLREKERGEGIFGGKGGRND